MKTALLAGALAAISEVNGKSTLESFVGNKLLSVVQNHAKGLDMSGESDGHPQVKAFGFDYNGLNTDGNWGVDLGLNADVGVSYELPLYN